MFSTRNFTDIIKIVFNNRNTCILHLVFPVSRTLSHNETIFNKNVTSMHVYTYGILWCYEKYTVVYASMDCIRSTVCKLNTLIQSTSKNLENLIFSLLFWCRKPKTTLDVIDFFKYFSVWLT